MNKIPKFEIKFLQHEGPFRLFDSLLQLQSPFSKMFQHQQIG